MSFSWTPFSCHASQTNRRLRLVVPYKMRTRHAKTIHKPQTNGTEFVNQLFYWLLYESTESQADPGNIQLEDQRRILL